MRRMRWLGAFSLAIVISYAGLLRLEVAGGLATPSMPGIVSSRASGPANFATAPDALAVLTAPGLDAILESSRSIAQAGTALEPLAGRLDRVALELNDILDRARSGAADDSTGVRTRALLAEAGQITAQADRLVAAAVATGEASGAADQLAPVCNCDAERAAVNAARTALIAAGRVLRNALATLGAATAAATLICAFFFVTPACLAALVAVAAATAAVSFAQDDFLAESARFRAAQANLAACLARVRTDPACRRPSG